MEKYNYKTCFHVCSENGILIQFKYILGFLENLELILNES
jgi:hypothetical protein